MWRHHIGRFLPVAAPAAFVLPTARITFCGKDRLGTLNGISMAGTFILFPLRLFIIGQNHFLFWLVLERGKFH